MTEADPSFEATCAKSRAAPVRSTLGIVMAHLRTIVFALFLHSSMAAESLAVGATAALPDAAMSLLAKPCPSLVEFGEIAVGDINGDHIDDFAAIVQCSDDGALSHRIVVLTRAHDGTLALAALSASWPLPARRSEQISIKQESLLISSTVSTYSDYWSTVYRFAFRDGRLLLAGLEHDSGSIGGNRVIKNQGIGLDVKNKKVIEWHRTRKDRRRQYHHRDVKNDYSVRLEDFSLDNAADAQSLR